MADSASDVRGGADAPPERARGFVRYEPAIEEEIFAFQREAFPTRRTDWVEPRWRWMFLASAERLGMAPQVWLYRDRHGIVAQQGGIPVRLHTRAGERLTGWFVETMVLERSRGRAVGPMLVAKAREELPFNLSLGQSEQMRELQYRLGWQRIAPLDTLAFVVNGRAAVAGKVPAVAAPVVGAGLRAWQQLRWVRGRLRAGTRFTTTSIERFGPIHDELWRRVAPAYPVAVVRDASYLNWKYVEQPGQDYTRLEVRREGSLAAIVVVSVAEPDRVYRTRRVLLTDIVVDPRSNADVWAAFEAVRQYAVLRGADLISFDIICEPLLKQALAFGFVKRDATRVLLVATESPAPPDQELTLDGRNWLVTRGDSDIDRPW